MIRRTMNLLEWWLTVANFSAPVVAFTIAGYVRFKSDLVRALYAKFAPGYPFAIDPDPYTYVALVLLVTVAWAVVVEYSELNKIRTLVTMRTGIYGTARATVCTMVLVLAMTFFYRDAAYSRVFVAMGTLLVLVVDVIMLQLFRMVAFGSHVMRRGRLKIAILGSDETAQQVASKLKNNPVLAFDISAYVSLPGQKAIPECQPAFDWERLADLVDEQQWHEVVLAVPPSRLGELREFLEEVHTLSIPARVVLDVGEGLMMPDRVFDLQGLTLLDVRPYAVDTVGYVVGKRIFDLAFSLAAIVLTGPIMLLIALLIKITSRGPVFFKQERVGLSGRRFWMLKFRSMVQQNDLGSSTQHTSRQDPRITPVGRFLRQTSLDELPQFFNVLAGDMSVVGPRPELTFFVQKFRQEIPSYMARHNLKCGITGWAQVNGLRGSDTSISMRIQYDLDYMRNWSLWLDVKIILRTVFGGLMGRNAY